MCPVWKVLVRFGAKNEVCSVKDEESVPAQVVMRCTLLCFPVTV